MPTWESVLRDAELSPQLLGSVSHIALDTALNHTRAAERTKLLAMLKDCGVTVVGQRQAIVNALGRMARGNVAKPQPSGSESTAPVPHFAGSGLNHAADGGGCHGSAAAAAGSSTASPTASTDGQTRIGNLRLSNALLQNAIVHVLNNGMSAMLRRITKQGVQIGRVLDVGACKGEWTREVMEVLPHARFDLVEPIAYEELSVINGPQIHVHQALLYSCETEVEWHELRNTGDSIYRERTAHYETVRPVRRRTSTLQGLFAAEGDVTFELIKLDVQGAELDVLRGGEALVRRASFVLLELPFMGQYNEGAPNFLQCLAYMDGLGFIPYDMPETHREGGILIQIDVMFVRRDHPLVRRCQATINRLGSESAPDALRVDLT